MKPIIVKPSSAEIWADDLLSRQMDAEFIISFLTKRIEERLETGQPGSFVLNIDAGWGQGKTFFLKRLKEQLALENHPVVYVNAWEDDHAEDPLIPIIAALDELAQTQQPVREKAEEVLQVVKTEGLNIAVAGTVSFAKSVGRHYIRKAMPDFDEVVSDAVERAAEKAGEAAMAKFFDRQSALLLNAFSSSRGSIERFRRALGALTDIYGKTLFILIDELDRCRPSYAIELLERVKHLFSVDRVAFIVATDTEQLQHSICAIYGQRFASRKYLSRFFDRSYIFDKPKLSALVAYLFDEANLDVSRCSSPLDDHQTLFGKYMKLFDLGLRDVEQCFDMFCTIVSTWQFLSKIELIPLIPMIVAHQQKDDELMDFLSHPNVGTIKKYSEKLKNNITINFRHGVEGRMQEPRLYDVMTEYLELCQTNLYGIENKSASTPYNRWIIHRYIDEVRSIYGSLGNHRPMSVVTQYPTLVRSAGRLIKLDDR